MAQLLSGTNLIISGDVNLAILGELVANISYETLKRENPETLLTESQYESFISAIATPLMECGLLDPNMRPTYKICSTASVL